MAQPGLDLCGATINHNTIEASFGTLEIQNVRPDQIILY